jgi:hypothetical protein
MVTVATTAAAGAGIVIPLLGAGAAQAADGGTWDKVAVCETGGLWSANTDNGFFGGLAITEATWNQYGGDAYAPRPDLASRAQQITVAEKILADLGPEAWPGCADAAGLLKDTATPSVDPGTPSATPILPGLPTSGATSTPAAGSGGQDGTGGTGGTGASTPASPGAASSAPTAPATGSTPTTGATPGSGTATTPPAAGATDPSSPTAGTGGQGGDQGGSGDQGVNPAPGQADGTPPVADGATPGTPTTGGGRHGKPYSPTDEQLAAADRASRTEVLSIAADGDGAGKAPGAGNGSGESGTSGTSHHDATYTVGHGDSLIGIASAQHVPGGWHALYEANQQKIGDDPNLIKPGQILNLG